MASTSLNIKIPLYRTKYDSADYSFLRDFVNSIWDDSKSRKVFFYLIVNLSFMFVEIIYGYFANSLGLIGDGVHMLLDCSAIVISLVASVISKWDATPRFSYGFARVEILAGFLNCSFLVYAACSIILEALERFIKPQEIETENLLSISILGFLVNLLGIAVFDHHHHHDHDHGDCHNHGHSHDSALFEGMYLHVLADALGSIGVVISSLLIRNYHWVYADSFCSLFISILILFSVYPLLKRTSFALLQATPEPVMHNIRTFYQNLMNISGITSYHDVHFWENSNTDYVASMTIIVAKDINEQLIRTSVQQCITQTFPQVRKMNIQIEKDVINL